MYLVTTCNGWRVSRVDPSRFITAGSGRKQSEVTTDESDLYDTNRFLEEARVRNHMIPLTNLSEKHLHFTGLAKTPCASHFRPCVSAEGCIRSQLTRNSKPVGEGMDGRREGGWVGGER